MNDQVEWLKAQVEAYVQDYPFLSVNDDPRATLEGFLEYIEKKFQPKGLFDR